MAVYGLQLLEGQYTISVFYRLSTIKAHIASRLMTVQLDGEYARSFRFAASPSRANCSEVEETSITHYFTTLKYIHNIPVKHG